MDLPTVVTTCGALLLVWWAKRYYISKERPGYYNAIMKYKTVRELDPIETMIVKIELNHGFSQTHCNLFSGRITPELLRQAVISMQQRHQCLRLGVHVAGHKWYFHEYDSPEEKIDITVIARKDATHWKSAVADRNTNYRSLTSNDRLLFRLLFLQNSDPEGPHEIILESFHVIIDGNSRIIFTRILLETLAALSENKPIPDEYYPLPKPHLELLFSGGRNTEHISWYYWMPDFYNIIRVFFHIALEPSPKNLFKWQHAEISKRKTAFHSFKLTKPTTEAFRKYCKEHGVTFNSGFLGIALTAAQTAFDVKEGEEIIVSIPSRISAVCQPPITTKHLSYMVSASPFKLKYPSPSEKELTFATQFQELVHKTPIIGSAIRECYEWGFLSHVIELLTPIMISGSDGARLANLMCSNTGIWDFPRKQGGISLEGWFAVHKETIIGTQMTHFMATIEGECCISTQSVDPCISQQATKRYTELICAEIEKVTKIPNGVILY